VSEQPLAPSSTSNDAVGDPLTPTAAMDTGSSQVGPPPPPSNAPLRAGEPGRVRRLISDLLYSYSVVWALIAEIIFFSVLRPDSFFTVANAQSILGSQAVLLIIALGLTIPLAVNEFDLSIGAVASFSQVILGWLAVYHHWPLGPAVLVALGLCVVVGLVNAALVVRIGVGAFIATLAMGTLLTGVAIKITDSQPIPNIPTTLVQLSGNTLLGLQLVFWYGLAEAIVLWYVLAKTPLGRWLYFAGANREAARLNGVPVAALRAGSFVASATIAGIAGILYAGIFGTADPNVGDTFLLPAFAAAFLGATAVTPGPFRVFGHHRDRRPEFRDWRDRLDLKRL